MMYRKLNLMLPTWRQDFAKVACVTLEVEKACPKNHAQQHVLTNIFNTLLSYSLDWESVVNTVTGYMLHQKVVPTSFIFAADTPNLIFREYQQFFPILWSSCSMRAITTVNLVPWYSKCGSLQALIFLHRMTIHTWRILCWILQKMFSWNDTKWRFKCFMHKIADERWSASKYRAKQE
jgi:hypothetical protein